ncbi:MAG: hypothetical protein ACREKS_02435 [Candidatus Rokuibacteriota bacterium]
MSETLTTPSPRWHLSAVDWYDVLSWPEDRGFYRIPGEYAREAEAQTAATAYLQARAARGNTVDPLYIERPDGTTTRWPPEDA